jgi:pyrroloquinoline-quinone synthase
MTESDLGKCLDGAVRQYDLRHHPLYQAWMFGALTRDDLREYSMEYYDHVTAFPIYLRELARRLPAGDVRHEVYQALCDVEGQNGRGRRAHATAWVAFAAELGADTATMRDRKPLPRTQQLIDIFLELARSGSEAEALAAFYAYQSQGWQLSVHKAAALRNHYGMRKEIVEFRHANAWARSAIQDFWQRPVSHNVCPHRG